MPESGLRAILAFSVKAIFSSLFAILIFLATPLRAGDWPQFLGPTRNGSYAGPPLAAAWPQEGPPRVWQKKVGQGFSGPVAAQNKLILFHRLDDQETVECLEASTGKPLWAFRYPTRYADDFGFDEGPRATPAISEQTVLTFGAEGMLHCLDLASGKQIWSVDTKKRFDPPKGFFGAACSPLVEGDAVLINVGGGGGAGVVAFDKRTGNVLWKAKSAEASYSSPAVAAVGGRRYALFFDRNGLAALDPVTGRSFFEFPWTPANRSSVNAATPLVIRDEVFLSTSYGKGAILLRFQEKGPEKIWSGDDILSNHYATSVHADGFLYGFDGRQEQGCNLRCVELKTGKVRWSQDGFGGGTLMLANQTLLILSEKGQLLMAPASPESFRPLPPAQILPFGVRAYPALADGLFYARSKDTLACLDLRPKK